MTWTPPTEPATPWTIPSKDSPTSTTPAESVSTFTDIKENAANCQAIVDGSTSWLAPTESGNWEDTGKAILCEDGTALLSEGNNSPIWLESKPWEEPAAGIEETWVKKSQA